MQVETTYRRDEKLREWLGEASMEGWNPGMDFYSNKGNYFLEMELPGVPKETISIDIHQGIMTVSGKKECEREEEVSYYLRECRFGPFKRNVRLPFDIEEKKVEAEYKDGVLTIQMPIIKGAEVKRIDIQAE